MIYQGQKDYHKQEITKEHLVSHIEQVVTTILRLLAVLQKKSINSFSSCDNRLIWKCPILPKVLCSWVE